MIDYTAARSLVKLPPTEFLAKVEKADGFSYRAGLLIRQRLRAVRNDASLPVETRTQAERLWRKLCRQEVERVKRVSKSMLNSAGEPNLSEAPPESKTKKVIVHNVETHRDCSAPLGRPCLGDPLVELLAYDLNREDYQDFQTEDEIRKALHERGHLREDL